MAEHGGQPDETFAAFVAARSSALLRTAFLLTGDRQLAEDLVQIALVKAAGVWPRIASSPEPYVRRIVYNENVSRWRRRRIGEVSVAEMPEVVSTPVDSDTRLVVLAALARLTPKQRAVLVLRFFDDLTERQAAEVLGIGVGTVKSQTRQALERLRTVAPELSDLVNANGDVQ